MTRPLIALVLTGILAPPAGRGAHGCRAAVVSRQGRVIRVLFHVPVPPLVLDARLVSNPGAFGSDCWDPSPSPPAIQQVAPEGPDIVAITLASAPAAASGKRLRHACTGTIGAWGGPTTGPRGNLRDSDPTASPQGYPLHNRAVHFDVAVP